MQRITRDEPLTIDRLRVVIYGPAGHLKTSLALTSGNPMLFDFDNAAYRAVTRGDIEVISNWDKMKKSIGSESDWIFEHDTIIYDTVGTELKYIVGYLEQGDTKYEKNKTFTFWNCLLLEHQKFVNRFYDSGKNIVFVCHEKYNEKIEKFEPDLYTSIKNDLLRLTDLIGFATIKGNKVCIDFTPNEGFTAKNPGNIPRIIFDKNDLEKDPNYMLNNVIQPTIDAVNTMHAAQAEAINEITALRTEISGLKTAEDFNEYAKTLKSNKYADQLRGHFKDCYLSKGFSYDKATKLIVGPAKKVSAPVKLHNTDNQELAKNDNVDVLQHFKNAIDTINNMDINEACQELNKLHEDALDLTDKKMSRIALQMIKEKGTQIKEDGLVIAFTDEPFEYDGTMYSNFYVGCQGE